MDQSVKKFGTHGADPQAALQAEQVRPQQANLWTVLLVMALVILAVIAAGAYAFDWKWTGFPGNKLWDWLNLLIRPVTLTVATIWFTGNHKWGQKWTVSMMVAGAILVVLAVGGYLFDWTWTGFHGNSVWDWLNLLLLPVTLTAVMIWFAGHRQWRAEWTLLVVVSGVVLAVLAVGGYLFDWTWTGFHGNRLWDWLNLLLLPVALTAVTAWFTAQQSSDNDTTSKQQAAFPPPYLVRSDGTALQLEGDILKVGRATDNHIVVNDEEVSRHHALLKREGTSYVLEDEGTPNGVFVNNQRVQRHLLAQGDVIRLGDTVFTYQMPVTEQ